MRRTPRIWLLLSLLTIAGPGPIRGEQPDAPAIPLPANAPPATPAVAANTPVAPGAEPAPAAKAGPSADAVAVRAATAERLRQLDDPAAKADEKADSKAEYRKTLRQLLEERLTTLDAWEKAFQAREKAEHPAVSPDREAAELKAERDRAQADLAKPVDALLPESFQKAERDGRAAAGLSEMKDAIAAAQDALKDLKDGLDALRTDADRKGGPLGELRGRRDAARKAIAALAARDSEQDAALAAATTAEARDLARERIVNIDWETRLQSERLREIEATLACETQHTALAELRRATREAKVLVAQRVLDLMQGRYKAVADLQQRDLARAAARERDKADRSHDPIDRYRARREALLLALQSELLKEEQELTSTPRPSPAEQSALADRAKEELDDLRTLIEGGRSNSLVALRLTNSYRRIAQERESVVARDLAAANAALSRYENALTGVELDILNDSRDDRMEFDNVLNMLPPRSHARAQEVFETVEAKHLSLLLRRQRVLKQLAARADATRKEVLRRIDFLEAQYAFIRTHIFWVRDATPIGLATLVQCRREATAIAAATAKLLGERWGLSSGLRPGAEFILSLLAALALPWFLYRTRRTLRRRLDAERPLTSTGSPG